MDLDTGCLLVTRSLSSRLFGPILRDVFFLRNLLFSSHDTEAATSMA